MAWFSFLQSEDNATPSSIVSPIKREIDFDNLENPLYENEIIAVKLNGININSKLSSTLQQSNDESSYIVVYENNSDDNFFIVTKSKVIDDYIYFKVIEDIEPSDVLDKKYTIYYGISNIKYLKNIDDNVYQQATEQEIKQFEDGDFYDLSEQEVDLAYYETTESSNKSFQLALYDNGNSWLDGKSTAVGAKAFGLFDGPNLYVLGSKGTNFGKFRIRIFEVLDNGTVTKTTPLDWQEVDCFQYQNLSNQILFETENFLEYKRYMFEIEVLYDKNSSSTSNQVEISSYKFIPNYKIYIESEQINSDLSFIRIGGIR
jgi:hypothetical protein